MTEVWWVDRWLIRLWGQAWGTASLHSLLRIPLASSSSSRHKTEDSLQDGWREECTRHLTMGGSPYSQSPLWIKMSQGKQVACHKYLLVAFSNSNAELSNFISMIIYLHCTDTKEKHPQVHSTIQYIYFKNIILYKRFIEHWHVHVTNSQSLSPICDSQNASKYCQFTITGHH